MPQSHLSALRRIPRGVWALGFVSMLMDLSSELIHSLLPLYMAIGLGASTLTIGIVEGIAEATAMIVKFFSGVLSDYFRKRKPLVVWGTALQVSPSSSFRSRRRWGGSSRRASPIASARGFAVRRATR